MAIVESLTTAGILAKINELIAGSRATLTATDVGLELVNNTSDVDKPVSTAQAAALSAGDALRVPLTQKGVANGVATLDAGGKLPITQLSLSSTPMNIQTFTTSGTWTKLTGAIAVYAKVLSGAGGGASSSGGTGNGGGGGGYSEYFFAPTELNATESVTIGSGGSGGSGSIGGNGGTSSFKTLSVSGGEGGGNSGYAKGGGLEAHRDGSAAGVNTAQPSWGGGGGGHYAGTISCNSNAGGGGGAGYNNAPRPGGFSTLAGNGGASANPTGVAGSIPSGGGGCGVTTGGAGARGQIVIITIF